MSYWLLWALPFAGVGVGLFLAFLLPGVLEDFYFDTLFPFGVTFWLGMLISYGWDMQRIWIQTIPPRYAAWAVGGCLVALLVMMGGPQAIIDDPWLAGMLAFPGIRMFMAYRRKHSTVRHA